MYLKQVKQFNERLYSIVCLISFTFYYRVVVKRMTRQYAVSLLLLFDDSLIKDHSKWCTINCSFLFTFSQFCWGGTLWTTPFPSHRGHGLYELRKVSDMTDRVPHPLFDALWMYNAVCMYAKCEYYDILYTLCSRFCWYYASDIHVCVLCRLYVIVCNCTLEASWCNTGECKIDF